MNLFFSMALILASPLIYSFTAITNTLYPYESDKSCPIISVAEKISAKHMEYSELNISITETEDDTQETFKKLDCKRFYDSNTCAYKSNINEALIDDFCMFTDGSVSACLYVYNCTYKLPNY